MYGHFCNARPCFMRLFYKTQVDSIGGARPTENLSVEGAKCVIQTAEKVAEHDESFHYAWAALFGSLRHVNEELPCFLASTSMRCNVLLMPRI